MRDFEIHKHECQDLNEKLRDQVLENAKGKSNADRVVKKVLALWENAFSDSEDEMHRKKDSLILKGNDKRSYSIDEDNRTKDAKSDKMTLSRCHKVK